MSKRILFVIGNLQVGGAERHLSLLLPELKRRGWAPELYLYTEGRAFAGPVAEAGVPIIDGSTWARPFHVLPSPLRGLVVRLMLVLRLAAQLLGNRYDLLHGFLPQPCVFLGLAAKLAGLFHKQGPLLLSRRSMNDYRHDTPLEWRIERALMRRSSVVLGNAISICDELAGEGVPKESLIYIPNGVDPRASQPSMDRMALRRREGLAENGLVMIMAASLSPRKGHLVLFEALRRITPQLPKDWILLCPGSGNNGYAESLREKAAYFDGHIQLPGPRTDIPDLNGLSDIGLLCPVFMEGMSNSLLEGMAAGLPFIVTDVGGNGEVVDYGNCGLLAPPADPDALGEAILRLVNSHEERRRLSDAAKARIASQYSFSGCVSRYERLYGSLLAGTGIPAELRPCA